MLCPHAVLGVSDRWTGFSTGMWDWNVGLECGVECGTGMRDWNVGLECGTGMWDWNVGLECETGMWDWNVGLEFGVHGHY